MKARFRRGSVPATTAWPVSTPEAWPDDLYGIRPEAGSGLFHFAPDGDGRAKRHLEDAGADHETAEVLHGRYLP